MKLKTILILLLSTLMLASLLCSCGVPTESETNPPNEEETVSEIPPEPQSLDELIAQFVPPLVDEELEDWKIKLQVSDWTNEHYRVDKPLVAIHIRQPDSGTVSKFIKAREQFDGKVMPEYAARNLLEYALATSFREKYIEPSSEFVADRWGGVLIVYASLEDMERYAACNQVLRIRSGQSYLLSSEEGTTPSLSFGKHLLPWKTYASFDKTPFTNEVTYYYYQTSCPLLYAKQYLNADHLEIVGVRAIPLVRIDSAEQISLPESENPFRSNEEWKKLIKNYNDEFFKTKSLFILTFSEASDSTFHTIDRIQCLNGTFCIVVEQHLPDPNTTLIKQNVTILVEVEKATLEGCTVFEAWINQE